MTEVDPLVSVVIPTFNRAGMIEAAVQSVQAQSYPHWEIIISDDGSKDNTKDIVQKLMGLDSRIRFIGRETNAGAQAARNAGIKAAQGEWIAFLDSDDQWLPDSLQRRMTIAMRDNVDVVHSNAYILHPGRDKEIYRVRPLSGNVYREVLSGEGPMFPCLLVRKNALESIGFLDESIRSYQEWDTAIRLAKKNTFGFEPEPTFIYDYRTDNAISRDSVRAGRGYEQIVRKHLWAIITHAGFEALWYHMDVAAQWYQKGNKRPEYVRCRIISVIGKSLNPKRVLRAVVHKARKILIPEKGI